MKKVLQKQAYDIISHRYGLLTIIVAVVIVTVAAFHFGETLLEWSHEKYAAVFNSYSDNVAGKSFRERLCQPVPIDVVYTWVNGSDPNLINQLKEMKMDMEVELNVSREERCIFTNCLATKQIVLDPVLPLEMTLDDLGQINSAFKDAVKMFTVTSPTEEKRNFTVVEFEEVDDLKEALNQELLVEKQNFTIKRAFYTSDWTVHNSILLSNTIIMAGFPPKYSADELKEKLPEKARDGIEKIELHSDLGLAVLFVPDSKAFNTLVSLTNISIDGKAPTLNAANIVWDLRDFRRDEDISSSRFEDNEELRYSLRSIERFAPWVRHVYIVTNGQIPYWLNLEYSRVTIVTHGELFPNKTHLPTFSSPAIEAHLHRIPGLSDKFIYMNDDVMFGKEVWPDDFFTYTNGQKVYLTWPVPNCNDGCPSSWIKDGYCDKACNNTECEWDGGDCSGDKVHAGAGAWQGYGYRSENEQNYCNKGCATSWLADRYCDTACNVYECGYDVGDCGTDRFNKLHGVELYNTTTTYKIPKGETVFYFNLTTLITDKGSIETAVYNETKVVRSASVANKFKVLPVLLYPKHNESTLLFYLKGHTGNSNITMQFNFSIVVDTGIKSDNESLLKEETGSYDKFQGNVSVAKNLTKLEDTVIYTIDEDKQSPHAKKSDVKLSAVPENINLTKDMLPDFLHEELSEILQQVQDDEITEKGFKLRQAALWDKYQHHLQDKSAKKSSQGHYRASRKLHHFVQIPVLNEGPYSGFVKRKSEVKSVDQSVVSLEENLDDVIRLGGDRDYEARLPWEQHGVFKKYMEEKERIATQRSYESANQRGRRLLDTFGDSLRHVNKLYNKAFGFVPRKVPGHMPHMIDRYVMNELQERFADVWAVTSSNKIRSSDDMQFAFSYFYYLMGVKKNITAEEVFDEVDTDKSRILSDREIRTLATRLYELPLDLPTLTGLEHTFQNCSKSLPPEKQEEKRALQNEEYYDKDMPQVTRSLFINCELITDLVASQFKPVNKYKYAIFEDDEIAFKMVKTNVSSVVGQLDDIRKNPKKFICLNDNIDHGTEESKTVKAILNDFYESVFPIQSQFELPREYRNRFLHTDELREWKAYRDWLKFWTHLALILLVIFTVASFFGDKIEAAHRKFMRRRGQRTSDDSSDSSSSSSSSSTHSNIQGTLMHV